jgi:sugar lactone lactonase YvrE
MRENLWALIAVHLILVACASAQEASVLRQVGTIALTNVEGRIDHMAYDAQGGRLFVAALGNNSVEVVDLKQGKVVHRITGLRNPQGIGFAPDLHKLFVANAKDGSCRVFDSQTYQQITSIDLQDDADNVRYDAAAKRIYIGHDGGQISGLDAQTTKTVFEVKLPAHPESFQFESKGRRIFVNLPDAGGVIAVVDRAKPAVVQTWPIRGAKSNFPMALDEANGRLFVGCRQPPKLAVMDTQTGKTVEALDCIGDSDDVWFDAKQRRVYASGGAGAISIFAQAAGGHYKLLASTPTARGARTSFFAPESGILYLAVPHQGQQNAELRVFKVE